MDSLPQLKVAAMQAASVLLDREGSIEKACRLIREAGEQGVQVAVFPECFVPGYPIWLDVHPPAGPRAFGFYRQLFAASVEVPSPSLARVAEAARKANMVVVLGICERRPGTTGSLYNSLVFFDNHGRIVGVHRKLVATLLERVVHSPGYGDMLEVYDTEFGRIGGLICGENSNHLAKFHLMSQGQTIHAACWPPYFFTKPMSEVIQFVSRAAAYENKVFVINAAGTVDEQSLQMIRPEGAEVRPDSSLIAASGGSSIVSPSGQVLAGPILGEEAILSCRIDLEEVIGQKMIHDFAGHYNRPDVFFFAARKHVDSFLDMTPPEAQTLGPEEASKTEGGGAAADGKG